MKVNKKLLVASSALLGVLLIGCGESVPVAPMPKDGSNPHVSGSPQERIKNIQADETLTQEEKDRRINVIKTRNNLK